MPRTSLTPYLRKGLFALGLLVFVILMVYLNVRHRGQICEQVDVKIDAPFERNLINEDLVKDRLEAWYSGGLSGAPKNDIDLNDIEARLEELPAVKNAEVSFNINGRVLIEVDQRIPVARIYKPNSSYYIDREFHKIPAEGVNSARVPIITGPLPGNMTKKVHTLACHVQENAFMEALVEQIFVDDNDLLIIPKIKDQQIVIGDTTDIADKFDRLEKFYKHGLNKVGFKKYKVINLKFKDQVVCN